MCLRPAFSLYFSLCLSRSVPLSLSVSISLCLSFSLCLCICPTFPFPFHRAQSSLLDLKLRAHFHALSFVSFAQIGFADGSTRIYPWVDRTAYRGASACQVGTERGWERYRRDGLARAVTEHAQQIENIFEFDFGAEYPLVNFNTRFFLTNS